MPSTSSAERTTRQVSRASAATLNTVQHNMPSTSSVEHPACGWADDWKRLQVLLRWALDKGCAVIPKSVRAERLAEYEEAALLTWTLSPEETAQLDALDDGHKYCWDASGIA